MVRSTHGSGTHEWLSNMYGLLGTNTIYQAEALGIGTQEYNLINLGPLEPDDSFNYLLLFLILVVVSVVGALVFLFLNCIAAKK